MKFELLLAAFDLKDLIGVPLRASVSIPTIVFALGAIGLNLHYGFTGLLTVGMVAFMAAGTAWCSARSAELRRAGTSRAASISRARRTIVGTSTHEKASWAALP